MCWKIKWWVLKRCGYSKCVGTQSKLWVPYLRVLISGYLSILTKTFVCVVICGITLWYILFLHKTYIMGSDFSIKSVVGNSLVLSTPSDYKYMCTLNAHMTSDGNITCECDITG